MYMSEYINVLSKIFFLAVFFLFVTIGFSYYFNVFTSIINHKVNNVKKKYIIRNEKEYLKFEGIYNMLIGILSFINFLTISFKEDWIFSVLWTTTVILNILIYISKKFQKDFLKNKI